MTSTLIDWLPYLARGALFTIGLAVVAIMLGTVSGFILGLLRFVPSKLVRTGLAWMTEVIRAIPLLLLLFFVFFAFPAIGLDIPTFPAAVLALSLWMMVNTAEVVRGGVQSISQGQTEAGRANGLNGLQIMRHIIVPQAIRRMIPPYIGICTILIKDTSLAAIIGAFELTRAAQETIAQTYQSLAVYLIAAAVYFCLCYPLSVLSRRVERRLQKGGG